MGFWDAVGGTIEKYSPKPPRRSLPHHRYSTSWENQPASLESHGMCSRWAGTTVPKSGLA